MISTTTSNAAITIRVLCYDPESELESELEMAKSNDNSCTLVQSSDCNSDLVNKLQAEIIAGFHLAVKSGPLMEEPLFKIKVVVENIEMMTVAVEEIGPGVIMGVVRSCIRHAFLTRPVRIVERYYRGEFQTSLEALGSLYDVLNRRRGRVIGEEMVENTDMILVLGEIPHSECFGLSAELVTASRGEAVVPILEIAGWVVCEKDPFWVPHSKEEREDYGEAHAYVDKKNEAKNAIAAVRKRKGLMGDLVLVQAEKQRTLKTNK